MIDIAIFCYAFVVGTAMPMIFARAYPAWEVRLAGVTVLNWFLILFVLCAACAAWIWQKQYRQSNALGGFWREIKWSVSARSAYLALLIMSAVFWSAANYYRAADTSSPHHVSHLLDDSISGRTVIRGVVSADPDDRGTHAFIDIQPEEIVKFSDGDFETDFTRPHVEFRTTVDRVIDGDTVELFEAPPVWLLPGTQPRQSVRLLGLNAPEIPHPGRVDQEAGVLAEPGGDEAKSFLKNKAEGKSSC